MNEIWKPITQIKRGNKILEFEGYEVSSLGRVRTYKEKYGQVKAGSKRPLRSEPYEIFGRIEKNKGYMLLCLSDVNKKRYNIRIHTVVMQSFMGFPDEGLVICHYNDIKTDNRLENLRYDTQDANHKDRVRNSKIFSDIR
jgi:hypothetical protein